MSDACCAPNDLHRTHLAAVADAGTTITPANHGGSAAGAVADTLFVGNITTNNPAQPNAEAVAVSNGVIIGVGSKAELDGLVGPNTKTVSPDGFVIPGLIEPHMHIWTSLLNLTALPAAAAQFFYRRHRTTIGR